MCLKTAAWLCVQLLVAKDHLLQADHGLLLIKTGSVERRSRSRLKSTVRRLFFSLTPEPREAPRSGEKEEVVYLNLSELYPFKDHPFEVKNDDESRIRSSGRAAASFAFTWNTTIWWSTTSCFTRILRNTWSTRTRADPFGRR